VLTDLGRLIAPLDVMYHVGNLIFRRSLRYTLFTVGISILGLLTSSLHLPGLTIEQAILLPLMIGAVTLVVGYLLKAIPSLISSRLLTVAQASDLNLMEDYRKSECAEHLEILWDRLFRDECRLRMASGRPALGCCRREEGESDADALQRAKLEFFARAGEALVTPAPQIGQMYRIGLDLRYLEDWRDGAYLDRSDTKLIEQFEGGAALVAARRQVGLCGSAATVRLLPRRIAQRFWFSFITRMVAIRVATAVEGLNGKHNTDLFNSQVLLWPGAEAEGWLDQFDGARDAVLRQRRQVVRRVFGPDLHTAGDVLDHMLYASFALATDLRMRYDPDYCDRQLGYDVVGDLQAEGRDPRDFESRRFAERARRDLEALQEVLRSARPKLLRPERLEALRAVRIAFHINRGGLKRRVLHAIRRSGAAAGLPAAAGMLIDQAAAEKEAYSRRLIAVRMHHELTRLARRGYRKLLADLAYAE